MSSPAHAAATALLDALRTRDDLARALVSSTRDNAVAIGVDIGGERVPLFRVTLVAGTLELAVRQERRWEPTPERGTPEELAEILAGPLRFIWFLDAEEALDNSVTDL